MGKGNLIGKRNSTLSGVWDLREQEMLQREGAWQPGGDFDSIISHFSGQNFSLYDFRPGTNSIFSDTSLTTSITTAGGAIAGVKDLGTNARDITQSTLGNRPTSVLNGAATFNGTTNYLDSSAAALNIKTCVIAARLNTGTSGNTGIVTNITDQGTNVDFAFTLTTTASWDTGQAAGGGLAAGSRFWRNKTTQTAGTTLDTLCIYSNDATGNANTLNFPNGLRVGLDRSNAGRYLNGSVGAIFIHSDSILSDSDRNLVEDTFASVFGVY